jgi:hypothetical protein
MRPLLLLSLVFATGCGRELPLEVPTAQQPLFYPGSLKLSADGNTGYIVNTNFNQRFSSGWISSFNVGTLVGAASPLLALQRQAFVPSMGGALALSADGTQAVLPHRGQALVTVLDLSPGTGGASCSGQGGSRAHLSTQLLRTSCDKNHLIDLVAGLGDRLPPAGVDRNGLRDPLAAVALPPPNASSMAIGFLSSSYLMTLDLAPPGGGAKVGQWVSLSPYLLNSLGVLPASTGTPLSTPQLIGTSHAHGIGSVGSTVLSVDVPSLLAAPSGGPLGAVTAGDVEGSCGGRGIAAVAAAPDGQHLYAINRHPNALVVLRRQQDPTTAVPGGAVRLAAAATLTVTAAQALDEVRLGDVLYVPRPNGDLLVASGVDTDRLYFFDPQGDNVSLLGSLRLGQGDGVFSLAHTQVGGKTILLATLFFSHGLAAFDLSGASLAQFTQLFAVHSVLAADPK